MNMNIKLNSQLYENEYEDDYNEDPDQEQYKHWNQNEDADDEI